MDRWSAKLGSLFATGVGLLASACATETTPQPDPKPENTAQVRQAYNCEGNDEDCGDPSLMCSAGWCVPRPYCGDGECNGDDNVWSCPDDCLGPGGGGGYCDWVPGGWCS